MDTTIFHWINNLAEHIAWANSAVSFYAKNGVVLFALLLVIAYLTARTRNIAAVAGTVWAGASAIVALLVAQSIGRPINRARPYATLRTVHLLVDKSTDFSFPSDHAATVGAVAVGLLLVNRRLGIIATVAAIVMAIARVYVGAHYPSDVLAGLAIGGTVAAVGARVVVPMTARVLGTFLSTPLRPLVTIISPTT